MDSVLQVGSHYYARYFVKEGFTVSWVFTRNISGYIERIFTTQDGYKELWSIWRKRYRWVSESYFTCSFLTFLPYAKKGIGPFFPWIAKNYLRFAFPNFKKTLVENRFQEVDVLWISDLFMIGLLKNVRYKTLVYRITDDVEGFRHVPPSIKVVEKDLLLRADVVFAAAKSSYEKAKKYNSRVYYLPNAVDCERFVQFKGKEPKEYQTIKSPRIIFVGSLSEWIDTGILKEIALRMPESSLVLIGPSEIDLSSIQRLPNVFALGKRSFNDIPAYLKYADVGIIPFKNNSFTNAIHPLKIYEYFASGLPVVSRDLEEIREMNSPAFLAEDEQAFIKMIAHAYRTGKDKNEYYEFARKNSWDERFEVVKRYVLAT